MHATSDRVRVAVAVEIAESDAVRTILHPEVPMLGAVTRDLGDEAPLTSAGSDKSRSQDQDIDAPLRQGTPGERASCRNLAARPRSPRSPRERTDRSRRGGVERAEREFAVRTGTSLA